MYLNEETQNISHDKVQNGTSLYNSFDIPLQIDFASRGKKSTVRMWWCAKLRLLPPFKIADYFGKSRYIDFVMHLDKYYV